MKILIAALIDFEDKNEPETDSGLAPKPAPRVPPFLDGLLRRLLREVREGRNPDIWEEDLHGSFFKS